jgi:hypothetical protein
VEAGKLLDLFRRADSPPDRSPHSP